MKLARLTDQDGHVIAINPLQAIAVRQDGRGETVIVPPNGHEIRVRESLPATLEIMDKALAGTA